MYQFRLPFRFQVSAIVVATRDFTVGPDHDVVVREGQLRNVELDDFGEFHTRTNSGHFLGMCRLGEGWKLCQPVTEPDPLTPTS